MTANDFSSAPYRMSNPTLVSTFGALVSQSHASLANIACVNAQEYLKDLVPFAHAFHTETIPAIHSNQADIFAVEYYDGNGNLMHRLRRFYNLVIGMCQSYQCSISALRNGFFYVQIRPSGSRDSSKFAQLGDADPIGVMAGVLDRLVLDAWEYDSSEYGRRYKKAPAEYHLTGLICEKAYVLFDNEVSAFVSAKAWR